METTSRFAFNKTEGSPSAMTALFGGSHSGVDADGAARGSASKQSRPKKPRKLPLARQAQREREEEAARYGMKPKDLIGL